MGRDRGCGPALSFCGQRPPGRFDPAAEDDDEQYRDGGAAARVGQPPSQCQADFIADQPTAPSRSSDADQISADVTLAIWNGQNRICEIPATSGTVARSGPVKRPRKIAHTPQAAEEAQRAVHLSAIARDRPGRQHVLLEAVADPVGDPVAQDRAHPPPPARPGKSPRRPRRWRAARRPARSGSSFRAPGRKERPAKDSPNDTTKAMAKADSG